MQPSAARMDVPIRLQKAVVMVASKARLCEPRSCKAREAAVAALRRCSETKQERGAASCSPNGRGHQTSEGCCNGRFEGEAVRTTILQGARSSRSSATAIQRNEAGAWCSQPQPEWTITSAFINKKKRPGYAPGLFLNNSD